MIEFQGVLMQQLFFLSLTYKGLSQNYLAYIVWSTALLCLLFLLMSTFRLLRFFFLLHVEYYVIMM